MNLQIHKILVLTILELLSDGRLLKDSAQWNADYIMWRGRTRDE
jgi:hypothetical protein